MKLKELSKGLEEYEKFGYLLVEKLYNRLEQNKLLLKTKQFKYCLWYRSNLDDLNDIGRIAQLDSIKFNSYSIYNSIENEIKLRIVITQEYTGYSDSFDFNYSDFEEIYCSRDYTKFYTYIDEQFKELIDLETKETSKEELLKFKKEKQKRYEEYLKFKREFESNLLISENGIPGNNCEATSLINAQKNI